MAEKMFESFNPIYNREDQVKRCTTSMLAEEVVEAIPVLVIGHNGRNFVSSTDWRITTKSGNKRILPFGIRPQYTNFVEVVSGVKYEATDDGFSITPDVKSSQKSSRVIIDNKEYFFEPGKVLKICINQGSHFIATDCMVACTEDDNMRTYTIIQDEKTIVGYFGNDGMISRY